MIKSGYLILGLPTFVTLELTKNEDLHFIIIFHCCCFCYMFCLKTVKNPGLLKPWD